MVIGCIFSIRPPAKRMVFFDSPSGMKHCSLLNVGEIQYRQRLEDIRLLKLEIKKLRREKHILTKSVANVEELRFAYIFMYDKYEMFVYYF